MKTVICALLFGAVTTGWAGAAEAEESQFSGQFCQGSAAADRTELVYGLYGAMNSDSGAARHYYCPVHWEANTASANTMGATVNYFDRSATDSLHCRITAVSSGGTNYLSPYRYSCSIASGCPSSTAAYWSTTHQYLLITLTHPFIGIYSWAIDCNIPRESTGAQLSGIEGYEAFF